MTTKMISALTQLNDAYGRTYTISQDGDGYTLLMPAGGSYPVCDAAAMMQRLVTMTHAAQGRVR